MAWFFSSSSSSPPSSSSSSTATSSINSSGANNSNNNNNNTNSNNGGGGCPVDHGKISSKSTSASGCPIDHSSSSSTINPLNMMPNMKNERVAGQTLDLPLERTQSTIPKGSAKGTSRTDESKGSGVWEYPSPQQFYNALVRKGWETPEESVETMVDIHNFLNEACWTEIKKWESKFHCDCHEISLVKFRGRPSEPTPKARMVGLLGGGKPFDRHDWTVDRCGQEVRYVIDYYGGADEGPDAPSFHVDVRPALDSVGSVVDRVRALFSNF